MSKRDIYQAILSVEPFLVSEFIDFQKASRVDCLFIIRKEFSRTHTTMSDNKYEIYNYSFLNKDQSIIPIESKEWKIEEVYEGYFGLCPHKVGKFHINRWSMWNDYLISDSNGELRRKNYANPKEALESLIKFSQFSSWSDYELENQIGDILND